MEQLSELHNSHIGRVAVAFYLSSSDLDPERVTLGIGVDPTSTSKKGEDVFSLKGEVGGQQKEGFWCLSSKGLIDSKDVNDHFGQLLEALLPHRNLILQLIDEFDAESFFDVLWESSYLYAGTGPVLSVKCIEGISRLRGAVGFDIYQIEPNTSD